MMIGWGPSRPSLEDGGSLRGLGRGGHRMGMAAPIFYTADMVRALPADGNRYETVRGELLVTPAPRVWNEVVVGRLCMALQEYIRTEPVGHAFGGRSDISW